MRIAYICADGGIPIFGCKGASIHVQEVLRAMVQQGHEVMVIAARLGGEAPADLAHVPVWRLPKLPKGDRAEREQAALSANLEIRLALEHGEPFSLVYERYSLWSFTAMEYAHTCGIPGVLEVNSPLLDEQRQHRGLVHLQQAEQVAQRVFQAASTLVAVSEPVAAYLNRYRVGGQVQVVPNGVNPRRFQPLSAQPWRGGDRFTVGFVGTMKQWHGLPVLIDAFAQLHQQLPQARLLLVGDGPERLALQEQAAAHHLTHAITWTGSVSADQIPSLLAQMDVAVAPYPDLDNFYFSPLKVYEYMAAGLPVIASDLGQLRQLIQSGHNGMLCPAGDQAALTASLLDLQRRPQLRRQIGRHARRTVLRHHTWDGVVRQILGLALGQTVPDMTETIPPAIALEVG